MLKYMEHFRTILKPIDNFHNQTPKASEIDDLHSSKNEPTVSPGKWNFCVIFVPHKVQTIVGEIGFKGSDLIEFKL